VNGGDGWTFSEERRRDGFAIERDLEGCESGRRGPKAGKTKNPVDHWSPAVLLERAAYLRKMAKHGDGSASETLKEYPQHFAMLSFRSRAARRKCTRSSRTCFACWRAATLVTGGVVTGARTVAPGETRGIVDRGRCAADDAGGRRCARAGGHAASDAGEGEDTIACLVMKVQEVSRRDFAKCGDHDGESLAILCSGPQPRWQADSEHLFQLPSWHAPPRPGIETFPMNQMRGIQRIWLRGLVGDEEARS
jgi:hypothetical protein